MASANKTTVDNFILLGLTSDPRLQVPLFVFFLLVYIITVVDNIGIICLYQYDSHLHTPMYFFISNLSFVDLCCSSTITPKMLMGFMVDKNMMSIGGCATQLFLFSIFAIAECLVMSLMAYDRYTAICKPLHYTVIMTERFCNHLAAFPYITGVVCATIYTIIIFCTPFCGDNIIPHYFCDLLPVLKLSCVDTTLNEMIIFAVVALLGCFNITALSMSYTYIIIAILRIHSSAGRRRVFSTCSSHLFCVVLFYGTGLNMYLRLGSRHSDEKDKAISVFYTIMISMLNPLIYSLRNKDVKAACWGVLKNKRCSCKD